MNAPDTSASAAGWKARLREALDDDLVEVRYAPLAEGFEFLIVHGPGGRLEALGRFLDAFRGPDMPPFDVRIVEVGRPYTEYTDMPAYVGV